MTRASAGGGAAGGVPALRPDPARVGPVDLSLYLVTDADQAAAQGRDIVTTVVRAVAGGVTAVQARTKDASVREFTELVLALAERLPAGVPLIVNDRVDVFLAARALGAQVAGIHVGQDDLPVEVVRHLVGPWALIGLSAATPSELAAAQASAAGVDYVGIGCVRATGSKSNAPAPLGCSGVARLARACALPAVAIGGIRAADLPALRHGGVAGAAVVSAICAAADPTAAAQELRRQWEAAV